MVVSKVPGEDRLVVSDAIAQAPKPLQVGVQGSPCANHMRERMLQERHPQALVILVPQQPSPEAKAQLGDNMTWRGGPAFFCGDLMNGLGEPCDLEPVERYGCVPPVGLTSRNGQLVVQCISQGNLKDVEVTPEGC